MTTLEILALASGLLKLGRDAVAAGKADVTDADVDAALGELGSTRERLRDAIERARERRAREGDR